MLERQRRLPSRLLLCRESKLRAVVHQVYCLHIGVSGGDAPAFVTFQNEAWTRMLGVVGVQGGSGHESGPPSIKRPCLFAWV